jgi:hypothetical protein
MTETPMPEIGKYRRARLIKDGYQIRTLDRRWLPVAHVTNITAPLSVVILKFADGPDLSFAGDDEVFSRTPVEAGRAARAAERAGAR